MAAIDLLAPGHDRSSAFALGRLTVTQAHQLKAAVIAMAGKRVEIAVDPAVSALPPNQQIRDPEGSLAER